MNSKYFGSDGHLTDDAFIDLDSGIADEMTRLEISEHLSFCDECVLRYSEYMENSVLEEIPPNLTKDISKAVVKYSLKDNIKRYLLVGTAACFAITFWVSGVFTPDFNKWENTDAGEIEEKVNDIKTKVSDDISKYINIKDLFKTERE